MIEKAGNSKSSQIIVAGSNHNHKSNNKLLIKEITQWLKQLIPGIPNAPK